jgi:hypothetical protein
VNEPEDLTAWVDRDGGTWVRVDDCPGRWGTWWPLTDGPGSDPQVQDGVGQARTWDEVDPEYGPFTEADPVRAARALDLVRQEAAR